MDKEQQIRINFLDEAQDCFDTIESALIGLSSGVAESEQLDLALRAAHSVKGGAGMMGFMPLSDIAHSLEDYFKILRVRYHSTQIETKVETLLLQGLDNLRRVSELTRQGVEIDDNWLKENVSSIFADLSEILGEVQPEDEQQLLNQDGDGDSDLEMVEQGMETIVEGFEQNWENLNLKQLREQLNLTSEKLITLAYMADIEPLVQLCESIENQVDMISEESLPSFAQQALILWQRSHGLIVRGNLEKLPSALEGFESAIKTSSTEIIELPEVLNGDDLPSTENFWVEEFNNINDVDGLDLETNEFNNDNFDLLSEIFDKSENIDQLQTELEKDLQDNSLTEESQNILNSATESKLDLELSKETKSSYQTLNSNSQNQVSKNIRVPVEQLYQFNNLFGKLILERNRVNLRLDQLKNFVALMHQRMNQLEKSNTQLRNWYDRAS